MIRIVRLLNQEKDRALQEKASHTASLQAGLLCLRSPEYTEACEASAVLLGLWGCKSPEAPAQTLQQPHGHTKLPTSSHHNLYST